MSLVETTKKAYAGLMTTAIELGGALIVIAIIVGTIAFPILINTSTVGWGATNILIWGTISIISLAALIMLVIGQFRKTGE
jgi:hypothetical protein